MMIVFYRYSYDKHGNIESLGRNGLQDGGSYGKVDELYYEYDGNRLCKVSNAVEAPLYKGAMHFADGADEDMEYSYDADGNMTADRNKGISGISYNVLNLPEHISFDSGKYLDIAYSSTGEKLRSLYRLNPPQIHEPGIKSLSSGIIGSVGDLGDSVYPTFSGVKDSLLSDYLYIMAYGMHRTDYCGDIIYEDLKTTPDRILFDGGYVTFTNKQPIYHFYLTDHQGNVRIVASAGGAVEETNHYYPFGALFGESAGGGRQHYKYNGKELDRLLALDWYDYGARWYDPVLARWHAIDPLANEAPGISPYVYCNNNAVNKIDPNGMDDYFTEAGLFMFNKGIGGNIYIRQGDNFVNFSSINLRKAKDLQMAAHIVGYYAKSIGVRFNLNGGKGNVGISTLPGKDVDNKLRVLAGTIDGNIYIKMKNGHLDEYMYDSYQLKGTLRHENEHKKMHDKDEGSANNLKHAQIILTEIQGPEFKHCSPEYQEGQIYQLSWYLGKAKKDKKEKNSIETIERLDQILKELRK